MWTIINESLQWVLILYIIYVLARLSSAQSNTRQALKIIKYVLWKYNDKQTDEGDN
jgi:hypothetical protein